MGNEDLVDDMRDFWFALLRHVEKYFAPTEASLALHTYIYLVLASCIIFVVQRLLRMDHYVGFVLSWVLKLFCIGFGSFIFLLKAGPVRRFRTAMRGDKAFIRCTDIRARGGWTRWRFFHPDDKTKAAVRSRRKRRPPKAPAETASTVE